MSNVLPNHKILTIHKKCKAISQYIDNYENVKKRNNLQLLVSDLQSPAHLMIKDMKLGIMTYHLFLHCLYIYIYIYIYKMHLSDKSSTAQHLKNIHAQQHNYEKFSPTTQQY